MIGSCLRVRFMRSPHFIYTFLSSTSKFAPLTFVLGLFVLDMHELVDTLNLPCNLPFYWI